MKRNDHLDASPEPVGPIANAVPKMGWLIAGAIVLSAVVVCASFSPHDSVRLGLWSAMIILMVFCLLVTGLGMAIKAFSSWRSEAIVDRERKMALAGRSRHSAPVSHRT